MPALRAWLAVPFLTISRWRWVLAALACVAVALIWGKAASWLPLLTLLGAPRRVPAPPDEPDPARSALDAHRAASEADRALAGVAAGSAAREAQGATAAATDPLAEVVARVEARAGTPRTTRGGQ
jgi:hypothetical protein